MENNDEVIGLKGIIVRYLRHWKLFLIVFLLSFIPAILYLVFYPRTYEFKTRIQIQEDQSLGGANLAMGEAAGLMKSFGIGGGSAGSISIDDEMSILSSNQLFCKMILDMGLYVEYTKPYSFYKMYGDAPLVLTPDSATLAALDDEYLFSVSVKPAKIKVKAASNTDSRKFTFTSLPAEITLGKNKFVLDFKDAKEKEQSFSLKIRCVPPSWLAEEMIDGFLVEDYSKTSNIIEITCQDHEKERGKDMLSTLIHEYNKDARSFKQTENMKLLTFIDGRIHNIMAELQQVEANIEGYKTKNRMTLLESDVMFYAEQMRELQVKIIEVEAESQVIKMMDDYIKNPNNKYNVIPSLLSADGEKGGAIAVYNEAIVERNRLLKNSNEKNPAFRSVSDQVDKLREGVYQMIDNSKKGYQIVLQDLKGKEKQLLDKMRSIPLLEREYVDFKRQQEILQGVYLILLQKREEIELTIGQQTDRARIVDKAYMLQKSVGPRKLYAAIAMLVLTLIIPVVWIECRDIYASIKEEYQRGDKRDK
ncbi:tyrosine protein kinase [Tannerella sp.]|uniref:GumC family protein n=1 Tax=Tannerella sp. TaxID=2382127 RepID=UPI0026DD82D3|nr:tyrosine protein kinase [Tannerella sp.]MDO4703930.1 tyrosine protein kinase [Tannerella sp.]